MANTNNNNTVVTWSAASTKSLAVNATRYDSDAITIHADAVGGFLQVTVDNSGTPAAGDVVDLWIKWSTDTSAYDTDEHAMPLGRMDTVAASTPGEDPATRTYKIDVSGGRSFKLSANAPQGTSRAITLSAIYNEHRMA